MLYWRNIFLFLDNLIRGSSSVPPPGGDVPGVVTPLLDNIYLVSSVIQTPFVDANLEIDLYDLADSSLLVFGISPVIDDVYNVSTVEIPI